mmetsp:Transcript_29572/g.91435  ORF Transcript_29572/g.91435 Transcript_29572/m.91435 type:complete len:265 (+) Transcript_29572:197-991(+)
MRPGTARGGGLRSPGPRRRARAAVGRRAVRGDGRRSKSRLRRRPQGAVSGARGARGGPGRRRLGRRPARRVPFREAQAEAPARRRAAGSRRARRLRSLLDRYLSYRTDVTAADAEGRAEDAAAPDPGLARLARALSAGLDPARARPLGLSKLRQNVAEIVQERPRRARNLSTVGYRAGLSGLRLAAAGLAFCCVHSPAARAHVSSGLKAAGAPAAELANALAAFADDVGDETEAAKTRSATLRGWAGAIAALEGGGGAGGTAAS